MKNILRPICGAALTGLVTLGLVGCKLDVLNPSVLDASTFDPSSDGATISLSGQTLFAQTLETVLVPTGWVSEELWSGALRAQNNDFSRRALLSTNIDVSATVFSPLSRSFVTNDDVAKTLSAGANAASDVNYARALMNAGFSLVLEAEAMCQGVIRNGPVLTTNQVLDSAIVRFQKAVTVASAATGSDAALVVSSSNVGMARAYLQKGDNANAATTAALVPSTAATYNFNAIDDPANRSLGNTIFSTGTSLVYAVPTLYLMNDSRVRWLNTNTKAQDASLTPLINQQKYTNYNTPIRIASYLEAQYILAEAKLKSGDASFANTLIAQRQGTAFALAPLPNGPFGDPNRSIPAGFNPTPLTAPSSDVLGQLMELRARDFWLEGKKLGDIRRNPTEKAYYDPPGTPFYKPGGPFASDVCFPVPLEETNPNPNIS